MPTELTEKTMDFEFADAADLSDEMWPEYRENSHLEVLSGKEKCLSAVYSMLADNRKQSVNRDEKHSLYLWLAIFFAHQISDDEMYEQIKTFRCSVQESFSRLLCSIRNPKKMVRYSLHSDSSTGLRGVNHWAELCCGE